MRILFPMGSFYPAQTGGSDNTVYWLTKALTVKGHQPVIPSTDRGLPSDIPRDTWIKTDYGEAIYSSNRFHYLPVKTIWRACSRLRETDILHLSMLTYPASFVTGVLNRYSWQRPVVWSVHGELDPPMLERSPMRKKVVLWIIRNFIQVCNIVFHSTCDTETSYIRTVFGSLAQIVQIPNYMKLPERLAGREKGNYLLYIGRIDPKKGLENLFRALSLSESFTTGSHVLKVAGDNNHAYGETLINLRDELGLTDRIEFVGHKAGLEKEVLLAEATFLLMPSHTENFGIVVIEALAQGTPALASTGTPWEILKEKEAGFWVSNEEAARATAIDQILRMTKEELAIMAEHGLKLVQEDFDIDKNIHHWESLYDSLQKKRYRTQKA